MAVQAQYLPNVLLLNRSQQEMEQGFLDQSPVFFSNGGANGNRRKRSREMPVPSTQQQPISLFSLQTGSIPSPTTFISLALLQNQTPPIVSTGLRLALDDQTQNQSPSNSFAKELALQIAQQKEEMDEFIVSQGELLRRTLSEMMQRNNQALAAAAESAAAQRLMEKESEVELAVRHGAELEDRLAQLTADAVAWRAKAVAEQAAAASLHHQLQCVLAAAAASREEGGESPSAEDAESAQIGPDRTEPSRVCRSCGRAAATVVALPCRHLCLCVGCGAAAAGGECPVCRRARSGCVEVFFS